MASARSTLIDVSSVTVLGICPLCDHRQLGYEEVAVRRGLLSHFYTRHDDSESRNFREALRKWLQRKAVAA
jgi:hypothetical protein